MKNKYRNRVLSNRGIIVCFMSLSFASQLYPRVSLGQDTQEISSPHLRTLQQQISAGESDAVGDFWAGLTGKLPLVEAIEGDGDHSLVTFVWRGDQKTKRVLLIGGVPAAQLHKPLGRLSKTDVWFRTERLHKATRMTYGFRINAPVKNYKSIEEIVASMVKFPPIPDPQNPNRSLMFSVLEMPLAPQQPWTKVDTNAPKGKRFNHKITSRILKEARQFVVYTPAGYDIKIAPCHLLVFFDAEIYTNKMFVPTPTILDNLIASRKLPQTVAVFIKNKPLPNARMKDLACSPSFAEFVASELVPWVRKHYRVSSDPTKAVVCGVSLGGLAAAYCGLKHSAVFGNVLSQSGTFPYAPGYVIKFPEYDTETGWLTREFVKSTKLPLRFYLEVGLFERNFPIHADPVLEHRRLRDVLKSMLYPVVYSEYYGGHDYICWRGSLADGLIALIGNQKNLPDSPWKSRSE